ncbi:MAG: TA system VapC family ribonuclease toxin [Verrucomicrobiales bacterium]
MRTVADVNVLFSLLVAGYPHHAVCWEWWERQSDRSVALCLPTRMGVLRLLTHARAMGGAPVTPEQALSAWDQLAGDPRTIWTEPTEDLDPLLRRFVAGRAPSPNLWSDAWLAAHAEALGCSLTSLDADFRSFGLKQFDWLRG